MKHKALRGLRVVLSLIIVVAGGGGQRDGFNLVVQQIDIIGPRQWLGLMTGSIVSMPRIANPAADIGIGVIYAG